MNLYDMAIVDGDTKQKINTAGDFAEFSYRAVERFSQIVPNLRRMTAHGARRHLADLPISLDRNVFDEVIWRIIRQNDKKLMFFNPDAPTERSTFVKPHLKSYIGFRASFSLYGDYYLGVNTFSGMDEPSMPARVGAKYEFAGRDNVTEAMPIFDALIDLGVDDRIRAMLFHQISDFPPRYGAMLGEVFYFKVPKLKCASPCEKLRRYRDGYILDLSVGGKFGQNPNLFQNVEDFRKNCDLSDVLF